MSEDEATKTRVGLISDTHGLLRPEALEVLAGCAHIVHAGDLGRPGIVERLQGLARVTAIRGNVDTEAWARRYPETAFAEVAGRRIFVIHDLHRMVFDPAARGISVVVSGHSHRPHIEHRDGVLYVNPGSAGPQRFTLPISVALLSVTEAEVSAEIIELQLQG